MSKGNGKLYDHTYTVKVRLEGCTCDPMTGKQCGMDENMLYNLFENNLVSPRESVMFVHHDFVEVPDSFVEDPPIGGIIDSLYGLLPPGEN